jgi:1-acyl-sn-glycerol-3-phosphate acyltransferase
MLSTQHQALCTEHYSMLRQFIATLLFLIATIVLSILSVPASLDPTGSIYSFLTRIWSHTFCFLYGIKVVVEGKRHISKKENYVFVCNHSSYTDIPILIVAIPKDIRLVLRHTLTRIPIWGWALLAGPFIVINRSNPVKSKRSITTAIRKIQKGENVLLFPEGTRTHDGKLQSFKRGAFHLAFAGGAKIIPVAINGAFELLPRTGSLPKTNRKIVVRIGEQLEPSTEKPTEKENELELMKRAEQAVAGLLSET